MPDYTSLEEARPDVYVASQSFTKNSADDPSMIISIPLETVAQQSLGFEKIPAQGQRSRHTPSTGLENRPYRRCIAIVGSRCYREHSIISVRTILEDLVSGDYSDAHIRDTGAFRQLPVEAARVGAKVSRDQMKSLPTVS